MDNSPILPKETLELYSVMDLIELIRTASEVLEEKTR